jgi:hypothetical protein
MFGEPMGFWHSMPRGMFLRSYRKQSSIVDPKQKLSLDGYESASGKKLGTPVSLEEFIAYGHWFREQSQLSVDPRLVTSISRRGTTFEVLLSDGDSCIADNVVVATGIGAFAWTPPIFDGFDSEHVTHSSEHRSFERFRGKTVLVVGAGQSALEAASFLGEAEAAVEVVVRKSELRFLRGESLNERNGRLANLLYPEWSVGPPGVNLLMGQPAVYRWLPARVAGPLAYRAIRPAGSVHLKSRLQGVRVTTGRAIRSAKAIGDTVRVVLDDGSERIVDHVVLGTGYAIDLRRYSFLPDDLREQIRLKGSSPKLTLAFESSVGGLYFVGAPAAASCGPGFRFVSHSGFAARAITKEIARRRTSRSAA